MNNNKFYNYDNNIEVLNEGFFDFIWKWTNRIFHSLFKVNDFTTLYKRVGELEELIKYGEIIKVKESTVINYDEKLYEGRSRSRTRHIVEADDTEEQNIDDPNELDIDTTPNDNGEHNVDMSKINMDVPSFPQVAKQLLNGLKSQMEQNKDKISIEKLNSDLEKINNGSTLSQRYVQSLEIMITDFLRKYSSGKLTLPKPEKDKTLSRDALKQWNEYSIKAKSSGDQKMFAYIYDAMEQIVNNYEKAYNEQYKNLKANEESFIRKYKNDDPSKRDRNFLSDWEDKINSKLQSVKANCIEFIPTAIIKYFISDDIYKNANEYVQLALKVLSANAKNISNIQDNDNELLDYIDEYTEGNKEQLNNSVYEIVENLKSVIDNNDEYKELKDDLSKINNDIIADAVVNITKIRNINKMNTAKLKMITSDDVNKVTNANTVQALVIALIIYSVNNKFRYKYGTINNIFDLLKTQNK